MASNRLSFGAWVMGKTPSKEILEQHWRDRLKLAFHQYREAARAVVEAQHIRSDAPTPDGFWAVNHALRNERDALLGYRRVLKILTDLVCHDQIPDGNGPFDVPDGTS